MAGSFNWFDSTQITESSEYSSRLGVQVRYLQIHHATMLSLSGLISMMQPGGRDVSANGALGSDGHLVEVVPATSRAFTSGVASFDRQCITVETCNTSLGPTWGISSASRERLARLAVAMFRAGWLGGLTRQFILGHNEVPGTYATACPGPDMNLDWIVARANQIYNAGGSGTAGDTTTPIGTEPYLMSYSFIKDAQSDLVVVQSGTTGDFVGVQSAYHLELLRRARKNDANDPMLLDEVRIVRGYLDALDNPDPEERAAILEALKAITIDPEDVKAAVKAAFEEGSFTVDAKVSDEQLDAFGERLSKLVGIRIAGGTLGA